MTDDRDRRRAAVRAAASNLAMFGEEWDHAEEAPRPRNGRSRGKPPPPPPWNRDEWDGMSEAEAFNACPSDVIDRYGREIAGVSWEHGSWATAWECRGRFFAQDEVELTECATAAEALECTGVDRDWFDAIESQWVDEEFIHLLAEDENA
ncbi:MAG: hypothetical protein P8008_07725 [Gammaproteobacteria bacterium]